MLLQNLKCAILLSVFLFSSVMGGHIWVEDPVLEFQNAKDIDNNRNGIIKISFSLESGLGPDDFLKLTFPEDLGDRATTYAVLLDSLNDNLTKDLAHFPLGPVAATTSDSAYYWTFGLPLNAATWYTLQISFSMDYNLPTVEQTLFSTPWTIQTTSSTFDADQIVYDENMSAGQIGRAAPPVAFTNVNISFAIATFN